MSAQLYQMYKGVIEFINPLFCHVQNSA